MAEITQCTPLGRSTAVGERIRPYSIARAVPAITEVVKCGPANGLMSAPRTVLPIPKRRFSNSISRAAQVGRGTCIEVGASHVVARCAASVAEIIKICFANRLSRSAEPIEVVEGGITDVGIRRYGPPTVDSFCAKLVAVTQSQIS